LTVFNHKEIHMAKGKVISGTPVTSSKFANKAGFNGKANSLGSDSQPGPGPGAPLMNSRTVDDYTAKKTFYARGIIPGSFSEINDKGVLGLEGKAPSVDSPVSKSTERPNPRAMSKAQEVASADPQSGLGTTFHPKGTLGGG
jgi:hypothetical protein